MSRQLHLLSCCRAVLEVWQSVARFHAVLSEGYFSDDLKWICKIIDHDLKINVGAKFVMTALHPSAWEGTPSFSAFCF
jgi:hypothetical protein